jgi:hypothetical protein
VVYDWRVRQAAKTANYRIALSRCRFARVTTGAASPRKERSPIAIPAADTNRVAYILLKFGLGEINVAENRCANTDAVVLAACAAPMRVSMTPEQRNKISEVKTHVIVPQDEVIAAVQPSAASFAGIGAGCSA